MWPICDFGPDGNVEERMKKEKGDFADSGDDDDEEDDDDDDGGHDHDHDDEDSAHVH